MTMILSLYPYYCNPFVQNGGRNLSYNSPFMVDVFYQKMQQMDFFSAVIFRCQLMGSYKAQCGKNEKFTLTEEIFREINSLVTQLLKTMLSRNFFESEMRVNFCTFLTVSDDHFSDCLIFDAFQIEGQIDVSQFQMAIFQKFRCQNAFEKLPNHCKK